jgi:hypothetical protein
MKHTLCSAIVPVASNTYPNPFLNLHHSGGLGVKEFLLYSTVCGIVPTTCKAMNEKRQENSKLFYSQTWGYEFSGGIRYSIQTEK